MKIAITSRVTKAPNYEEIRDAISQEWAEVLENLKLKIIFIPNNLKNLPEFLDEVNVDGIILSGGDNIGDHPKRDQTENKLIKYGIKKNIPIFGVCRGMQVINQYFDGKIRTSNSNYHVNQYHEVLISDNFDKYLKRNSEKVNSFHHNFISEEDLGKDLRSFAKHKKDSTVEGMYHKIFPIVGVMWHPERDPNDFNRLILQKIFYDKKFW